MMFAQVWDLLESILLHKCVEFLLFFIQFFYALHNCEGVYPFITSPTKDKEGGADIQVSMRILLVSSLA